MLCIDVWIEFFCCCRVNLVRFFDVYLNPNVWRPCCWGLFYFCLHMERDRIVVCKDLYVLAFWWVGGSIGALGTGTARFGRFCSGCSGPWGLLDIEC